MPEGRSRSRIIILFVLITACTLGIVFIMTELISLSLRSSDLITKNPQASFGDNLRGMIFLIKYPAKQNKEERINVEPNGAYRVVSISEQQRTYGEKIIVPNDIQEHLEVLRQQWCTHPPVNSNKSPQLYIIVVDCGLNISPIIYYSEEQLPVPILDLMRVVPYMAKTSS